MGKLIDLTNKQFGELTVLRRATKEEILNNITASSTDTHAFWWVQCSCGTPPFITSGRSLRDNKTKSCGHLRKEIGKYKIKDLTSQKFGHLKVLCFVEIKNHNAIWYCQCDCGNKKNITSSALLSGNTTSCGCRPNRKNYSHPVNLINEQFGFLKPLYMTDKRTNDGHVIWHCKCLKCNNEIDISSHTLQVGHAISCGCIQSKGEEKISQILTVNQISYEREKTFNNCISLKTNAKLKFDFFINNKYIIEYDGQQHFKTTNNGWDTEKHLEETQFRDNIKNQWCKENNIPLIRIPYTHFNELCLEDLLLETSKFIVE